MLDNFIRPKDNLTKVLWIQYRNSCSVAEACRIMSVLHEPKSWLMSGNPMTIEACVEKCKRWQRRFSVSYEILNESKINVKMPLVTFTYDWKSHEAVLSADEKASENIGWTSSTYILKGKHCCDIEKIFTINERLENALELPRMIEWCKANAIYEKKKEELKNLIAQLEWWRGTIQSYSFHDVKLASRRQLANRIPLDNIISIKSFIGLGWLKRFRFNANDPKALDSYFAQRFLPEMDYRLSRAEKMIEYLSVKPSEIPSYPLNTNSSGLSIYKGFRKRLYKRDVYGEIKKVYDKLYDASLHLYTYDEKCYKSGLAFFQINLPEKDNPLVEIYISIEHRYLIRSINFSLKCLPDELEKKFPPFYDEFWQVACKQANCLRDTINHKIWMINNGFAEK